MQKRTLKERALHATLFEVIAVLITAPVAAWIMGRSVFEMGILAIVLSTVAMIWNMIYNIIFDKIFAIPHLSRTIRLRMVHAAGFEVGFIFIGMGVVAAMLGVNLWTAFMMEAGFFLFFLPYTMLYNWIYDHARFKIMTHKMQKSDVVKC